MNRKPRKSSTRSSSFFTGRGGSQAVSGAPNYPRYIVYGILLGLVFLIQCSGILPRIDHVILPLPLIPFVTCLAVHESDTVSAAYGFAAGILMDIPFSHRNGLNPILLMIIGCVCSLFILHLMQSNLLSCLMLTFGGLFIYFFCDWLLTYVFPGYAHPLRYFFYFQVPALFYTLIFVFPFYYLLRWISRKMT